MRRNVLVAFATAITVAPALGQSPIVYNAARGSLPSAQCFTEAGSANLFSLEAGELHIGPTPGPGFGYIERNDFSMSFDAGFVMEASFRIASADCGFNSSGSVRHAIQLSASDDQGNFCAAHFCSTAIALVNTPNGAPSPNTAVTIPYALAGTSIVARVVINATTCQLFIDEAPVISIPRGSYVAPSRSFYFGDGTLQGGADFFVSYVRASGSTPSCTPTSTTHVASGCSGLGTLSVSGILQPGQAATQTFGIPGTIQHGVGLFLVGLYSMQTPYCSAGCRLGLAPSTAILAPGDTLLINYPAASALAGVPIAIQGVRTGGSPGACSAPLVHSLTDICVVTP